ncbi:UDP-3-O-(3-hydroxymyristoyl)glucosamine N-acyltransferase [Hwanghaeella grinnelliae]|uniref:UDP-3-O-acylglucosamine N-acyltransferase n=1 Tax=Hwanghaeella grinnelliae TaxID=2500179 RepID=A0A437QXR8_9PROT|nr:UDP-3-O-(3-hydroxymyristoyl)glucosamine N-acyltransferase [Hwanghaeella grinnelliae]RVU39327.1 UDP-3-O-(3-hydroxymyristoyl)glucosamine N-acyltransferase [Hwanghaeella grinnelliae]
MADPRFFQRHGPFTLGDLAKIGEAVLQSPESGSKEIRDIGTLTDSGEDQISFLDNRKYVSAFSQTEAGACVVAPRDVEKAPADCRLLVSDAPYRSFALIVQAFYPLPATVPGIHPSAVIADSAKLGDGICVDAGAVIGEGASVGARTHIGANAVLGTGITIGADGRVGANSTLECCDVGERVQIHPGARIGTRGFGFAMDPRGHVELPQLGRVVIGNDVEIGANSTIDRGMGPDTVIGDGTKIDNLVQIGHNVRLGKHCVLAGQTGIAGSAVLEDFVICAAKVGVAGHLTIGAGTRIAAMSGVTKSVPAGSTFAGVPAGEHRNWLRKNALLNRMVKEQE